MQMSKDALNELKEAWESTLDAIFLEPQSIEEIVGNLSENTDKLIMKKEKLNELSFIAGTFKIMAHCDNNEAIAKAELFFQTRSKEWVKDELTKRFTHRLFKEGEFEKLLSQGSIDFKIVHPLK